MTTKQLKTKLENYFKIGAIVGGYAGLDRVIDFDWNGGDWAVKVQAIKADGSIDNRWPYPRRHATRPSDKELGIIKLKRVHTYATQ